MGRKLKFRFLAFILVGLIIAGAGGLLFLKRIDQAMPPPVLQNANFSYVIAREVITRAEIISSGSVMLHYDPAFEPPPEIITEKADIVGKLARVDRLPGQIFLPEMLFDQSAWRATASPIIFDDVAYFWNIDGHLFALNTVTKQVLWHFEVETSVYSPLAITDGLVCFFAGSEGKLYALDAETGQIVWTFEVTGLTNQEEFSAPVIQKGTIYFVGHNNESIHAVNIKTGLEIWQFKVRNLFLSPPTIIDDAVYFTDNRGKLYKVDAETGQTIWELNMVG